MRFVLDASVTLAWCLRDEGGDYPARVLEALRDGEAVAPVLWPLEVTNGLMVAERRGRLTPGDASRASHLIRSLPVAIDPLERRTTFEGTHRLARAHRLSSYDASYLELALRLGVPLATLDAPLRAAAESEGCQTFV